MASYKVLCRRKYRSAICWDEVGKAQLLGSENILEMTEQVKLIRIKMAMVQSRQKSYANSSRRDLTFKDGDWV